MTARKRSKKVTQKCDYLHLILVLDRTNEQEKEIAEWLFRKKRGKNGFSKQIKDVLSAYIAEKKASGELDLTAPEIKKIEEPKKVKKPVVRRRKRRTRKTKEVGDGEKVNKPRRPKKRSKKSIQKRS